MMYAVEAARIDTHECAETAWFDTLAEATAYAETLADQGEWYISIIETTGEPGAEGKIIY